MPIYSIVDLYPIYEDTHDKIKPSNIATYPKVAATIYLIMRIDGEIKNGGVAQLIWNLHEMYDYEHLYEVLKRVGSKKGYEIVKKAVDYIYKTEKRKNAFFAKGPFGAAKPLQKLTNDYYNLPSSVSADLLTYVEENWGNKELKKLVKKLKLENILKVSFTKEQVFDAVEEANLKQLESMLAVGFDVNMQDKRKKNLIEKCFRSSDKPQVRVKIVKRLVEAGALVNAVDEEGGKTVLNAISFYGGRLEYLKCLVELGADIEHKGVRGKTTIFGLVKKYKNLQYFIDLGANIHHKTSDGFTPLGYALSDIGRFIDDKTHAFRHERIPELEQSIKLLFQHGAKLSETPITWFQRTELSYVTGDLALLKLLSKETSFKKIPEFIIPKGTWTALHEASKEGNAASLKFLLEEGMNPNLILETEDLDRNAFAGATPLDVAKDKKTVRLLEQYEAEKGIQSYYALYLKTRGSNTKSLAVLVAKTQKISLKEASELVQQLPKEEGKTLEWDENDNLIRYKELLLTTFDNKKAAQSILDELQILDVITKLL